MMIFSVSTTNALGRTCMDSLAKTISMLEERRANLTHELGQINDQLAAVAALLQGNGALREKAASSPRNGAKRTGAGRGASPKARRSWFAREEAGKLLRKAAKSGKSAADLVRRVAALKGYEGTLSPDDMRRFQSATFM